MGLSGVEVRKKKMIPIVFSRTLHLCVIEAENFPNV